MKNPLVKFCKWYLTKYYGFKVLILHEDKVRVIQLKESIDLQVTTALQEKIIEQKLLKFIRAAIQEKVIQSTIIKRTFNDRPTDYFGTITIIGRFIK